MAGGWLWDKTNKRFGPKFPNFKHLKKSRGVHRKNTYWTHPGHERQQKVTMIVLCRVAYLQFRSRRSQKIVHVLLSVLSKTLSKEIYANVKRLPYIRGKMHWFIQGMRYDYGSAGAGASWRALGLKTAGAHSTRNHKISGCKRWCPKDLRVRTPATPVLTHSLHK